MTQGLAIADGKAVGVDFEVAVAVAFDVGVAFEVPRIETLPNPARVSRELWGTCLSRRRVLSPTRLIRAGFGDPTEGRATALRSPFLCLLSFGEAKESERLPGRPRLISTE